jgi:hypothetical protein
MTHTPERLAKRRIYDAKRARESATRRLYKTPRWQRIRADTLRRDPNCVRCKAEGRGLVPSTVCNHVVPHRGDVGKFWKGPFEGVCATCHDTAIQLEELDGFSRTIGADGWPTDPRHPVNQESRPDDQAEP